MIKGHRVTLRAVERDDVDTIWRWENDAEVMAFASSAPERCVSRAMLERSFADVNPNGGGTNRYLVLDEEERPIGLASYWVPNPRFARSAELGVYLGERDLWRKGYGTDAVITLLKMLFHQLGMHRVGFATGSHNFRVKAAMEKYGVRVEGVIREDRFMDGRFYDTVRMGVLADELDAILERWTQDMESRLRIHRAESEEETVVASQA